VYDQGGPKSGQKRKQVSKDDPELPQDDSEPNKQDGRTTEAARTRTTMSAEKGKEIARNNVPSYRESQPGQRAEENESDIAPQPEPLDSVMASEPDYTVGSSDISDLQSTSSSNTASAAFVNGDDKTQHTMPSACSIDSGPDSAIDMFYWPANDEMDFTMMLPTPDETMIPDPFASVSLHPAEPDAMTRSQSMSTGNDNQCDTILVDISTFTSKLSSTAPIIPTPPSSSSSSRPASHSSEANQKPRAIGKQSQSTPSSSHDQACHCLGNIADLLDKHEAEKDNPSTDGVDDWLASLKESIRYLNDMLVCVKCVRKPENMTILMFLADSILSSCKGHVNQYLLLQQQQSNTGDNSNSSSKKTGTSISTNATVMRHSTYAAAAPPPCTSPECESSSIGGGGGSHPIYFGSYSVDSGSPMMETLVKTMILWHLRELQACVNLMKTVSATSAGVDPERFSKCFHRASATQARITSLVNQLTPLSLPHPATGESVASFLA
jgi:hypothetical protein